MCGHLLVIKRVCVCTCMLALQTASVSACVCVRVNLAVLPTISSIDILQRRCLLKKDQEGEG